MKLTDAQQRVLEMLESGLFIWTNEGADLKAWIGPNGGTVTEGVRIRTVEILLEAGKIELQDGDYPDGLFQYWLKNH